MCHRLEVECDMYLTLPCTKNVHWNCQQVWGRKWVIGCSILNVCARKRSNWKKERSGRKSFFSNDLMCSIASDGACVVVKFVKCVAVNKVNGQMLKLLEIAIGKIQLKITMAVHILNATKRECGKVWNIPSRWWIKERMRYENYNGNLPRASLLHPARGKRRK